MLKKLKGKQIEYMLLWGRTLSFNEVLIGVGLGVTTTVIATGITFYIKDYLKERTKFRKFKEKLSQIAGKNAEVLIPIFGLVKIIEINKQGIIVENQLCKTFIPMEKVMQTEVSLPVKNYDELRKELAVKTMKESLDLMLPPLMDKMKEVFVKEFLDNKSELNAVVALQVKSALQDERRERIPTFKEIIDQAEKNDKKKK